MAYCQNCGKYSSYGRFCMECGTELAVPSPSPIESVDAGNNEKKKKVIIGSVIASVLALILLIVFLAIPRTVDEACDWCGSRPSYEYVSSKGNIIYYCGECASECMWCGEKPTHQYENMVEMPVFVCDECYIRVMKESGFLPDD